MKKMSVFIKPDILERLEQLDKLTVLMNQFFPISIENRLWPVLKNHRLTLLTDDPYLATQARFQQNTLCKYLSKNLNTPIRGMDIKVISLPLASFEQKKDSFKLSANAANIVGSIAQSIHDDELRETVLRLSKIAGPSNQGY